MMLSGKRVFAVSWARERLTILDGDDETIVALLGGDLSTPHQFIGVCEASSFAEMARHVRDLTVSLDVPW